jgi:hypothetical protein
MGGDKRDDYGHLVHDLHVLEPLLDWTPSHWLLVALNDCLDGASLHSYRLIYGR